MEIRSEAFGDGAGIPARFTCEGDDVSPPLAWTGLPAGTASLALIVDDPDAPDPARPRMTWVHWVLYNIPPEVTGIPEGRGVKPEGAQDGRNDWKRTGYGGPCPPIGTHRYFFKLYALNRRIPDLANPTKSQLEKAMAGHILAKAELIGTYEKRRT